MPQADLFKLFLFLFLTISTASAQTVDQYHAAIQTAFASRDYRKTIDELTKLEKSERKIFTVNNYDYLLARAAEKSGDLATAMANYQKVATRDSVLSEYALWHLSQIARASGNFLLERIYLQKIVASAPQSLLIDAAEKRTARSFFDSKNYVSAIQTLNNSAQSTFNAERSTRTLSREDSFFLAEAYLSSGDGGQARAIFTKLVSDLPNPAQPDDYALEAVKSLDALDGGAENFKKKAPELSEPEHLRRAAVYQFNRSFPLARLHFQAIAERFPASANAAYALFQIGRSYVQENNYSQAINYFERVQTEFSEQSIAKDALTQAASAYARVNKPKEALARYQKFLANYPDADNLERAYLNIIDVLRDRGADHEALQWTEKTQTIFKNKFPESLALFAQARINISLNDWASALSDLDKLLTQPDLGGVRVAGGTNKTEIAFLKGYVLEQMGNHAGAIDVYLSIPDGRNEYYGWRATERLKFLAADEQSKTAVAQKLESLRNITRQNVSANTAEAIRLAAQSAVRLISSGTTALGNSSESSAGKEALLNTIRQTYALLPAYRKTPTGKTLEFGRRKILQNKRVTEDENHHRNLADELLFLGLYDEGTPELEIALSKNESSKTENDIKANESPAADLKFTLAVFYNRGDMANRAVAYAEPLWKNVPADFQLELIPREQIELLYPAPYKDALLQHAPSRAVDPRFVLSIMRQESRYRPDVKSNAAARGSMQFISTTANQIARELNRENFRQDELYNPSIAVLFGAQYLSNLFRQFPNQPPAVAGSYNAGEDNIARWMARSNSTEADRYVPEILYAQSKDYIYKVMANYRVYQMFYDENFK